VRRLLTVIFVLSIFLYFNSFAQQPYGGTPWPIPGKIEAEDYDTGGEGVAYHDTDAANNGGLYRSDGVDIETCGEGGYNVGWMEAGEWLEYTVKVAETGLYTIRLRVASVEVDGGKCHIEFDDANVTGTIAAPSTGAWQTYTWVEITRVPLNSGQQVMRVVIEENWFNLNYLYIVRVYDTQVPNVSVVSPQDGDEFEIRTPITIRADASDADGTIQKVEFFQNGDKIGEDTATPYELVWTPSEAGKVFFHVVATDNVGASTTSDSVETRINPPELPDSPVFSNTHGFYDSAFNLIVSWDSTGSMILYTLDGSDPKTSSTVFEKASPATIRIDPISTQGRAATPAVVVRAYALVNGAAVTNVGANTYIFITKVKTQSYPGGNWPQPGYVNGRILDYEMDPDVVNDFQYKNLINDALIDIPSICINSDLGSLFDPDTGIYVNPTRRGMDWERAASIELIDPRQQEKGFQINVGLRIRGGYSRIGDQPKQAFRFFFRTEYGKGKLEYPLFQEEGVSSFDCVDLRTAQNYSWSYQPFSGHICIFIRDVFSRDCQAAMGQPYTRSRAYHLYLDGMYWGLYQTEERPEASYAESYFGGDKDNYDVVKVDQTNGYVMEATDGNLNAYNTLWDYCQIGFKTNSDYFKVQGKNADGSVNWAYPVLVNPENLIDYLLIIYYTGNFDSPVTAFGGNYNPNNIYGIYDHIGRDGFLYFIHDAEHTLVDPQYSENPDYGLDRTGPYPGGSQKEKFNPQWLHQKLSENAEYRVLFSDRVYKHFFNKGSLTQDSVQARFQKRADEISMAVIVESARWGDSKVYPSRTKNDDWLPAIGWVKNNFFPTRLGIVLGQLKNKNLYPSVDPPVFYSGLKEIQDDVMTLNAGAKIRLVNNNAGKTGSIWYTLDGSDPRAVGGANGPLATEAGDDQEIAIGSNTVIKARVKNGSMWSALHELLLNTGEDLSGLKITEIHYHPLADQDINGSEFEFVELKNAGSSSVPLAGAYFVKGIDYRFPDGASVVPGGFVVLASNSSMFLKRYGFAPFGEYYGQLDNGGERVALVDASSDTLISVRYNDKSPWPLEPDSTGQSLVAKIRIPSGDPNLPEYWTTSANIGGSPGANDPVSSVEETPCRMHQTFRLEQNYPNPFNPSTEIRFVVPRASYLSIIIYDLLGRKVGTLAQGYFSPGSYTIRWNAQRQRSGLYFCRLEAQGIRMTRKLTLLK
jgi:hypothetical protein